MPKSFEGYEEQNIDTGRKRKKSGKGFAGEMESNLERVSTKKTSVAKKPPSPDHKCTGGKLEPNSRGSHSYGS